MKTEIGILIDRALTDKERGYIVKGGTGNPVRTLVAVALAMAK